MFSSRFYMWPNYLVLAGLCFRALSPQMPLALAEQRLSSDYSLLAIEAILIPYVNDSDKTLNEIGFILHDNNFVQAFYAIGNACYKSQPEVKPPVVKPADKLVQKLDRVIVTAYSSTPDQTDSSPFITANGAYVYDGLVACNFLPFHTKVKFPEVYGDKIFIVEDRMAKHNSHKMDIWMPSRQLALNFGVKKLAYEVVK